MGASCNNHKKLAQSAMHFTIRQVSNSAVEIQGFENTQISAALVAIDFTFQPLAFKYWSQKSKDTSLFSKSTTRKSKTMVEGVRVMANHRDAAVPVQPQSTTGAYSDPSCSTITGRVCFLWLPDCQLLSDIRLRRTL